MKQFYEPPKQNHRADLHDLFPQKATNPEITNFMPFNQERDKLGRLISQQNKPMVKFNSVQLNSKVEELSSDLTERGKTSDHTVERIFKVHSIQNLHKSKDKGLRISSGMNSNFIPSVGQYDFAQSADKLKFRRTNQPAFKIKAKSLPHHPLQRIDEKETVLTTKILSSRVREEKQTHLFHNKKLELNPNLPQLRNFHTMQRLQMEISSNFERDHERFKKLVRDSMLLAGKIKRELELD